MLGGAHVTAVGRVAQAFKQQAGAQHGRADRGNVQHALAQVGQGGNGHGPDQQSTQGQRVAAKGRSDLPMVPKRTGLDAVAANHVVQACGAAQNRQVAKNAGQPAGACHAWQAADVA